jgi:hypothetical protein
MSSSASSSAPAAATAAAAASTSDNNEIGFDHPDLHLPTPASEFVAFDRVSLRVDLLLAVDLLRVFFDLLRVGLLVLVAGNSSVIRER